MKNNSKFGVREWSDFSANVSIGCANDCRYCYARNNFLNKNPDGIWKEEKKDDSRFNAEIMKKDGVIMFPTVHDITPSNIDYVVPYLIKLLEKGNELLIVSKPRYECIDRLTTELFPWKENIMFRFTIGAINDDILAFWEPNASSFDERLSSLKLAFDRDFETSVSAEPLLDLDGVNFLIEELKPFVTDTIWIGKMNFIDKRVDVKGLKSSEIDFIKKYEKAFNDEYVFSLYNKYKDDSKVEWKESIKKIVGVE